MSNISYLTSSHKGRTTQGKGGAIEPKSLIAATLGGNVKSKESVEQDKLGERAINYVRARRCQGGGFCFYRLEEPNGSDTYYALSALSLLGMEMKDYDTMNLLKNLQEDDGSYVNIFLAYYAIKSLIVLGEKPKYDPTSYLSNIVRDCLVDSSELPVWTVSMFNSWYCLIDLSFSLKIQLEQELMKDIVASILASLKEDKGFGDIRSTLLETSQALAILKQLNYPVGSLNVENFIKKCEDPDSGFTGVPNTSMSYLEQVHGGLVACRVLSYKPRYLDQCISFVKGCQNHNGSFSRQRGISTLEDTYYAIHSLSMLAALRNL